ncbi:MAG: MBL fold metallo-hydrolase [Bacteroidales bacterium]|nr:MBL fold metallo-hydrolase [Bacteroidales bacterium]
MKIRFLGTGTSTGVPSLLCDCKVCRSTDSRDHRQRCSALVTADNGANLLIDCGPDFYQQMLAAGSPPIDALLVTHHHYDHVGGVDDLRPYCHHRPADAGNFPIYALPEVMDDIHRRMPYCFGEHLYPGVPTFDLHTIGGTRSFEAAGVEVTPLPVIHGPAQITGFRIGPLGYITDCSTLPEESRKILKGVDTLVINALRIKPHPSHMNLQESLAVIAEIKPRQALLIHMSHDIGLHAEIDAALPQGVSLAYDGLELKI